MLICYKCGQVVDEEDLEVIYDRDYVNNGLGMECIREDSSYSECSCGGEWIKATECELCGEWFNDYNYLSICEKCLLESATVENAVKFGNHEDFKTEIKINGYLASEYSETQIEELLLRDLKEAESAGCCLNYTDFCLFDKYDFADWLKKEKEGI